MTGIAGVAVRPDVARSGVATHLMRETMAELAQNGVALSTLYASTQTLYRKVGFEAAGTRYEAVLQPLHIEHDERPLILRSITQADHPRIHALYATLAAERNGHLDRSSYIWNRTIRGRFGVTTYGMVVESGDDVEGYVLYRKNPTQPPMHRIWLTDIQASTARAYRHLWTFLRDLSTSVVVEIGFQTSPADAAYLCFSNPRFRMRQTDNWMLRISDPKAALEERGYPAAVKAHLSFELDDDVLPSPSRFMLHVEDGVGRVEQGGNGSVRLDVRALAALYSGFASPRTLARLDRIQAPEAVLKLAATIFSGPHPWMPDMF